MSSYAITGASRGLGYEFVVQLSTNPKNIVFPLVRNRNSNPDLIKLADERPNIHIVIADVMDNVALKSASEEIAQVTGGSLDVLINNAAYTADASLWHDTLELVGKEDFFVQEARKAFDVNVLGVVLATNHFLPLLRKGSEKKVVSIGTLAADLDFATRGGLLNFLAYGSTKAAMNMVIKKYALSLQDEGFSVVGISPGVVGTEVLQSDGEPSEAMIKLAARFKTAEPWFSGPITPTESIDAMLKIISTLKPEENGTILTHLRSDHWTN